jgi:hypothetical protein
LQDQPYSFTSFNQASLLFFLMSGDDLFSLSRPFENFSGSLINITTAIHLALKRRGAGFSLIVLEEGVSGYTLLYATNTPHYNYYKHCEQEVYNSIIKFLGYAPLYRDPC